MEKFNLLPHQVICIDSKSFWKTVRITGKDASDFFQRMCTQKILGRETGDWAPAAFLTGTGGVEVLFHLLWTENEIWAVMEHESLQPFLNFIEKFHFAEDLICEPTAQQWVEVLDSKKKFDVRADEFGKHVRISGKWPQIFPPSFLTGLQSFLVPIQKDIPGTIQVEGLSSAKSVSFEDWNYLKIAAGFCIDRLNIRQDQILIEAPLLEPFAHANKGCYPGQEVIERIRTYGKVAKKLVTLFAEIDSSPGPTEIFVDGLVVKSGEDGKDVGRTLVIARKDKKLVASAVVQRLAVTKSLVSTWPLVANQEIHWSMAEASTTKK